jgi:cytochrome c5
VGAKQIVVFVFAAALPAVAADPRALLDTYCVTCHNQQARVAGLMLDKADASDIPAAPEVWEKVIRKLRAGAMPPAGSPRPDPSDAAALITALETSLDRAAAAAPHPGRFILHRLSRTEYANAIRDLLSLDIDVSSLLPPDDESYGFDNIADVLGVSPALLEQYVNASQKIVRHAIGDMSIGPVVETYRTRPDLSQDQHVEGLPLGTRGGLVVRHNFPLDGEYTLKVVLARNSVEVTRGLEEPHRIEILVDGDRVFQSTVGGREDTDAATKNPISSRQALEARLQIRVHVKAGPRTVGVTFVRQDNAEVDTLLQPFLRTTLDPVNETGLPHVESLMIAGPYNATGPGDTPSRRRVFTCQPASSGEELPCATQIIGTVVRRAYRRPVTSADLEPLLAFYRAGRTDGNFESAIARSLRLILSNPQFLFRFERDPASLAAGSVYRIGNAELASRLSFFLWSSIPDDELLNADLSASGVLEKQVRRMLADPRSESLINNFAEQWLFLRNLRAVTPDPRSFPDFDDNLRQSMRRETALFVASIVREDRSVLDFLDADYTFVDERLARHYGIPGIYGSRFRRVRIEDPARRGLLGQSSILTVNSYATRTSPVLRGKWILTNILGTPPPIPPPNTPPLKENAEGVKPMSVRERMEDHRRNPACAGCHATMDPLGLALENFDAVGKWRTKSEDGVRIDASGVLPDGAKVDGPASLRDALLARPDRFASTLAEKLLTFALGRGLDYNDAPAVRKIAAQAAASDYRFSSLILAIVRSTPFQMKVKAAP